MAIGGIITTCIIMYGILSILIVGYFTEEEE